MNKIRINTNRRIYEVEEFGCEFCLLEDVIETLVDHKAIKKSEFSEVCVACDSEFIRNLIRAVPMLSINDNFAVPNFIDYDSDGCDEYCITLSYSDDSFDYYIEPAYIIDENTNKKIYYYFGSDVMYIQDTCNSKLLIENNKYANKNIVCFSIMDEEDFDGCSVEDFE